MGRPPLSAAGAFRCVELVHGRRHVYGQRGRVRLAHHHPLDVTPGRVERTLDFFTSTLVSQSLRGLQVDPEGVAVRPALERLDLLRVHGGTGDVDGVLAAVQPARPQFRRHVAMRPTEVLQDVLVGEVPQGMRTRERLGGDREGAVTQPDVEDGLDLLEAGFGVGDDDCTDLHRGLGCLDLLPLHGVKREGGVRPGSRQVRGREDDAGGCRIATCCSGIHGMSLSGREQWWMMFSGNDRRTSLFIACIYFIIFYL